MAAMLDWRLSLMIEEQRLTNQLLGNIAQLLRIPDSQKQRVYHIEQGLKYLKNAILEGTNSTFYTDALEGFQEAEKIERKDFITLSRIGFIYLYSQTHLNIPLAEEYFLKSAREAFAEANASGTTASNYFAPQGNLPQIYSQSPFHAATAEAYLYASRACYLQQKINEASDLAGKAYNLIPEFVEAGFEQAKYLAASNRETEAAMVLHTVIDKDRYFSRKTLLDADLLTKQPILNLLDNFYKKAIWNAKSGLSHCKGKISKKNMVDGIISDIEKNISKDNFLSAMKAIDLLNADYQFVYKRCHKGNEGINRRGEPLTLKLVDYIEKEKESIKEFEELKRVVQSEIINQRVLNFGFGGGVAGFVLGFFAGCTIRTLSMNWGTLFLTTIICALLGAGIGFLIGQNKEPWIHDQ